MQLSGILRTAAQTAPLTLLMLFGSALASAQTVTLYGSLSNFDVINDTGQETHGFEIEIQGTTSIGGTFTWNRYGAPQITSFGTGVYVRYMSAYDPASGKWIQTTPVAVKPTVTNGHQCVLGTLGYDTSGCEHFGVWTPQNATKVIYRWLVADPNNPGKLMPSGSLVAIPAPIWTVQPPVQPADPPVVVAVVAAPVPPPPAKLYGPAQWMKVYKTENGRQVGLDELVADNPVVPEDPAEIEVSWDLIQDDLNAGGNGKRKRKQNQGVLGNGSHAVVRRYEFYKFTGTYDPVTNEALCADLACNAPADNEVGDFIGAQNAAANLNVPASYTLTVAVTGNGQVDGTPGSIKCPSACSATVLDGTVFTLTAKPSSGYVLAGWSGACQGTSLTCTVTLRSSATATANFVPLYTLSVGRSGKGSVVSNPDGISCGTGKSGSCSTKFPQGTRVTLTAVPDPGSTWTGWAGACTGTALTCTVPMSNNTSVNANFK